MQTALDLARKLCIVHRDDGMVVVCPTGMHGESSGARVFDAAGDLDAIPADAVRQIEELKAKLAAAEAVAERLRAKPGVAG